MRKLKQTGAGAAVVLALCSNAATQPPRLWLEQAHIQQGGRSSTDPAAVMEIKLVLEAGSAPVEVQTLDGVMPRLRDASGNVVGLSDWRAIAGMAPPQPPKPPQPPLAPGKRHVVCSYTVVRRPEGGYHLMAPYGGADVPRGTYVISAKLALTPTTREMWTAQLRAAGGQLARRGSGKKSPTNPEVEAEKYAAHWQTVDGFFKGLVETPELTFTLR